MFYPLEGWCNPIEAANYFLKGAEDHGATLLFNHQVCSMHLHVLPVCCHKVQQLSAATSSG